MSEFEWNPEWATHNLTIDTQHHGLVSQVGKLIDSVVNGDSAAETLYTLRYLEEYVEIHFQTEEVFMAETGFPGAAEHLAAHADLREWVRSLVRAQKRTSRPLTSEVMDYLTGWFRGHFTTLDQELAHYLRQRHHPSA